MSTHRQQLKKIRRLIVFFGVMTLLSGVTAFCVESELHWLLQFSNHIPGSLSTFMAETYISIAKMNKETPQLYYGYDWLAFAHIVIAMAFIGPYKNPVQNIWIIEWAMLACIAVLPLALIAGPLRGIPFYWRMIDCSFGIIGIIPLWICRKWIKQYEMMNKVQ
jgi:hypothetical protein